jgi:aminoglycoside phosphotransferase (APT) family kinase protein
MDSREARRALQGAEVEVESVVPIGDGWANWTFLVDERRIVRFPRNDSVAAATRRELVLLPELARHVSFAVPSPTIVGEWAGRPFFAYERIEGRPLDGTDADVAGSLGHMLAELHSFPVDRAASLLGAPPATRAWHDHYQALWTEVEEVAIPELDDRAAEAVRRAFGSMLEHTPQFPTCLIHNDLGPVHVLLGRDDLPAGIIDFEDAWLGDPATDLTPLVACLGRPALPALMAGRDLGERVEDRMHFYRWMGSIHAIIYGVRAHVEAERVAGIRELRRRLPTAFG